MKGIAFSVMVVCLTSCKESSKPPVSQEDLPTSKQSSARQFVAAPSLQEEKAKAPEESRIRPEAKKYPDSAKPTPPVGEAVEGREGFVISPISGSMLDVRGMPPGTLVRDPMASSGDGIFRTPDVAPSDDQPEESN